MKKNTSPPSLVIRFFRWFCHPEYAEDIEGDLRERHSIRIQKFSKTRSNILFILDVVRLFRPELIQFLSQGQKLNTQMFTTYLKISSRVIRREKGFTAINLTGLSLALTCAFLIFGFVKFHSEFNLFHHQKERIYRFVTEQHRDQISYAAAVPNPFGNTFREEFDYHEKVARIVTTTNILVTIDETAKFNETVAFVEADYFDIFNYPLQSGSITNALSEPNSAIITKNLASKYFGQNDPIGRTLEIEGHISLKITGILENIPTNSDFQQQFFISYPTIKQYNEWFADETFWNGLTRSMQCFVRLKPGVDKTDVEEALSVYPERFRPGSFNRHVYKLQPLEDIHFSTLYDGVMSKKTLNILILIGIFILIAACINFINLSTALASKRAREIGVSKVIGANRISLFWRFCIETGIITTLSIVIALFLAHFLKPILNDWLGDALKFDLVTDLQFLLLLPAMLIIVVLLAGFYPGLVISGLKPVKALKGKISNSNKSNLTLRRGLIVGQFIISQLLILGMIVMLKQMDYTGSDLGFNKESIVMVRLGSNDNKTETIKEQLRNLPAVDKISMCFAPPATTHNRWGTNIRFENRQESEAFSVQYKGADHDYLSTFDIPLLAGRNLFPSDTAREFLVNETFVKKLNFSSVEEVIGKNIAIGGEQYSGPIVGVVKDFYDNSFFEERSAICVTTDIESYNLYAIKLSSQPIHISLSEIEDLWTSAYPEQLFSYEFLDEDIGNFYESETIMIQLIKAFAFVAIVISCLGLLGLISYMVVQRRKEIAIRKVLGGNLLQLMNIFQLEFVKLILIAFLVSIPIGWYIMNAWLNGFTYKIDLNARVFIFTMLISLFITLATIGYKSLKASRINPADGLKSE